MTKLSNRQTKDTLPLRLSPSSIGVFQLCRQQYKFLYLDKLGDQYRRAKPFFTMANHVHATLKDFFTITPVERRTVDTIARLLQKNWRRYQVGFRNAEDERRWMEKALLQLSAFVQNTDVTIEPLTTEWSFETLVTPGVVLNGRIDRIDRQHDGTLHIIDYKTGTMPQKMEWMQVQLNALAAEQNLHLSVSKISYFYLGSGTLTSSAVSPEDIDRINWELLQIARTIRKEKHYLPSAGKWCRGCDFHSICPGAPEMPPPPQEGQLELWEDLNIA